MNDVVGGIQSWKLQSNPNPPPRNSYWDVFFAEWTKQSSQITKFWQQRSTGNLLSKTSRSDSRWKCKLWNISEKKSHLWISFWYLLMNLKNKYLLKNCWGGPIKNKIVLIFTMLHFLKKIKKNTWRYHYFTTVYQKLW